MKAVRGLAPALAVALILTACNADDGDVDESPDPADGDGTEASIVIGWSPPDVTGVFKTATDYFEEAAAEAGEGGIDVQIDTRSPTTHTDFADQVAIIEDFITRGVDAIVISPADTEAIKPAIRDANAAGIPVILVNLLEEQADVEVAAYIGFDNTEAAQVSGYAVLDYYGGPGVLGDGEAIDPPDDGYLDLAWWESVYADADTSAIAAKGVIIEGISGTFFADTRNTGFHNAVDPVAGIEVLGSPIPGDWNRELGTAAAEDFLTRYGEGDLDFIWAASNEMGLGAASAAEQRERLDASGGTTPPERGKVAVFTNDVTPESVDAIREGRIVAETHHGFAEWGWLGTAAAVRLACGLEVEQFQDIRPRTVYQGNADDFYPNMALPEIPWSDIAASCQR